ncbi:MAG: adenosine deaminase [Coprobacillus sp.]|nr:adenosine deaminase [Coprobacillus sp.]
MIDLHLHLDGSLSKDDIPILCELNHVKVPKNLDSLLQVDPHCSSLEEYLTKFDFPLSLLQNKDSVRFAFYSLTTRLYERGYIYAEIRFAPQLHTQKGCTQEEIVKAALDGIALALEETNPNAFKANIILCCMRNGTLKSNLETIEVADKFRHEGVVAVDLAGDETLHPAPHYQEIFDLAYSKGLNITIHGGEATGSEEVINAIRVLHAKRIGHGVHLILSPENVELVKDRKIGFEFCPTSNLQTTSLHSYSECPVKQFLEFDIPVTINSDNITVSSTYVEDEFIHLMQEDQLTKDDVYKLLSNSIEISFTTSEDKDRMKFLLDEHFEEYYGKLETLANEK